MKFDASHFADEIEGFVKSIDDKTELAVKRGLYDGARIMADALKKEASALPEDYGYIDLSRPRKKARLTGLLSKQIDGLVEGIGIATMKRKGNRIYVSIGFDGYNEYRTNKYPNGQPNNLIARSLVKGTSYLTPNPFVQRAFEKAKSEAERRIGKEIERVLTEDNIK